MRRAARSYRIAITAILLTVVIDVRASGQDELSDGLAALADGAFERAAAVLSDFVSKNPSHPSAPQAMCGAGQALVSMGQDAKALEFFEAALQQNSERIREAPVRLACARCLLKLGKASDAVSHCQRAIQISRSARERTIAYPLLISALCKDSQMW